MSEEPVTPTERVAYVTWRLAHGQRMTTAQVSAEVGITERGARMMMVDISRIIPILRNDDGEWVWSMVEALRQL